MAIKKIVSLLLAFAILCGLNTNFALANEPSRTPISSYSDLLNITQNMAGNYYLTCNITVPENTEFKPLGSIDNRFSGSLDGCGYSISNLTFSPIGKNSQIAGLIAYNCGTIKNLSLKNIAFTAQTVDCSYLYVGGICAYNLSGGVINNCTVRGSINFTTALVNYTNIGGIVCQNSGKEIVNAISNVDISVTSSDSANIGGICATSTGNIIWRSQNNGNIVVCAEGDCNIGGIASKLEGTSSRIQDTINYGNITETYLDTCESMFIGGIFGSSEGSASSIASYNVNCGLIAYKEPNTMASQMRRCYVGSTFGNCTINEISHDNYYLENTFAKGIGYSTAALVTESTANNLRTLFSTRNEWYLPTDTSLPPRIKSYFNFTVKPVNGTALEEELCGTTVNGSIEVYWQFVGYTEYIKTLNVSDVTALDNQTVKIEYNGINSEALLNIYTLGDVNQDGYITVSDVVKLRSGILGSPLTSGQTLAAKFSEGNTVTVTDAVALIDKILAE